MPKSFERDIENLNVKLDLIGSLLEQGNFKQALAEIEELRSSVELDEFSIQAGELYYLNAFVLDKLGRSKQALTKAKRAYEILRNTERNRKLAQIQQLMGRIYSKLGELKNAEIQFTDTASTYRRIGDQKGIAETYNELARVCFLRSEYGRATEYVTDALHLFRETKDQKMVAWVSGNLGTILMLRDRWGQAEEHLLQSLEANQALNDGFNVCKSLLSLGYLSCLLRKLSQADEYLKKASILINENNYLRELAILHEYQGSLDWARGEQDSAGRHFREAVGIGEQLGPKGAIISQAYRLLAELQVDCGDSEEALISCDRSLLASQNIGERLEEAAVYRTLGRIYSQNGHADRVRENFDRAIRIFEDIGVKHELARTYLFVTECDDFSYWEKLKCLGRAEDLTSRLDTPYYLAKVHVGFAEMFLKEEKFDQARDFLSKAKDVFRKLDEKQDLEMLSSLERKVEQGTGGGHSIQVGDSAEDNYFDGIITQDEAILKILEKVAQVKDSDISILLEGETGTGKDLLAKAIHCASNRGKGQFVAVNCAERAEGLLESELFGHKRGSFTGAVADKRGFVEEAHGGTLYLDEIADVSPSVQVKLLRAIEEKEIVRLGEVKPRKVDFRVIATTNKDLDELVSQGKFRSDLFYRLNGIRFRLPALRERKNDIPLLVEHFLKKHRQNEMSKNGGCEGEEFVSVPTVDKNVMGLLLGYPWPGNIRELDNLVKQMAIFSDGQPMITEKPLAGILEKLTVNGKISEEATLPDRVKQIVKEEINKALAKAGGNISKAARILGIGEARLRYQMKTLRINYPGKTD
jgi:transcriptional regulator with PAS, ATPase and Fis domain